MIDRWPLARRTQLYERHDATKQRGDCLRAAIASLLGMELEDVPHFADIEHQRQDDDPLGGAWWWSYVGWCQLINPAFDVVTIDPGTWPDPDDPTDPLGGCYLLAGKSPRGDFNHAVVGRAGGIVWDPHPSRHGLRGEPQSAERLVLRRHPMPSMADAAPFGTRTRYLDEDVA